MALYKHEYYALCGFEEQASYTDDGTKRCNGDFYVHMNNLWWYQADDLVCPVACDTGTCVQGASYPTIGQNTEITYSCTEGEASFQIGFVLKLR